VPEADGTTGIDPFSGPSFEDRLLQTAREILSGVWRTRLRRIRNQDRPFQSKLGAGEQQFVIQRVSQCWEGLDADKCMAFREELRQIVAEKDVQRPEDAGERLSLPRHRETLEWALHVDAMERVQATLPLSIKVVVGRW
jgi:hypothetical protein